MINQSWIELLHGRDYEAWPSLTSALQARKCITNGATTYLAFIVEDFDSNKEIQGIPIVEEYPKVFIDDLPGLPPIEK